MFNEDALYITKDGYFMAQYDSKQEKYVGIPYDLSEIETCLNKRIVLADDVRLHHVFTPIINSEIFPIVFKRDFWRGIMEEIKNNPWKEWEYDKNDPSLITEESLLYLEVYHIGSYEKDSNEFFDLESHWDFHGVSQKIPYSLSATSITDYMYHPIKVGTSSLYDEDDNPIIEKAKSPITLNAFLHAILWDMSFYGIGQDRDNFLNDARESLD